MTKIRTVEENFCRETHSEPHDFRNFGEKYTDLLNNELNFNFRIANEEDMRLSKYNSNDIEKKGIGCI